MTTSGVHHALGRDPFRVRQSSPMCRKGLHEMTAANTFEWADGKRCRKCRQLTEQIRYERRKVRGLPTKGGGHRMRALAYDVAYERIHPAKVYERDDWLCGICGHRIDPDLKHPHPMSKTIDHVIPMSMGGGHLYVNVQAAHYRCNNVKGNRRRAPLRRRIE